MSSTKISAAERARQIKAVRKILGDSYAYEERRGAKTNELGMTKTQVILLATEIVDHFIPEGQE